jgi:hypothetical protein
MIRPTKDERQAASIGNALVKALSRLEEISFDPEMIFDSININSLRPGVKDAMEVLGKHYLGEED